MPSVVVIGGGFSGVETARRLEHGLPRGWQVVLLSKENHFVFTPLLGEVVGASINAMHVVWPIRQMARRVDCRTAVVTSIDFAGRSVCYEGADGRVASEPYDQLVLACGSSVKLDLVPGMAAHAWPLRTLGDAIALRDHAIGRMEAAECAPDRELRRRLLSFAVIGGGFSGVEVAGSLSDLLLEASRYYHRVSPEDIRVTLIESKPRILHELPEPLAEFALTKMRARGMDIRLAVRVASVTERGIRLASGDTVEAGTVISTIGNTANQLIAGCGLPLVKDRVATGPDMRVPGPIGVWALGDCAAVPAPGGALWPPTAQVAVRQARQLAENVARAILGEPPLPFQFQILGELAPIGHHRAVGRILGVPLSGFLAWFIWRGIYLSKMPTFARKVQIAFDWAWNLFFPRDIVQLNLRRTPRLGREHFDSNQFVCRKGDPANKFYVIERGRVCRLDDEAAEPLAVLGPGDHFGELEGTKHTASMRAEEPLDVLTMDEASFKTLTTNMAALRRELENSARRARAGQEFVRWAREHPKMAGLKVKDVMRNPVVTLEASSSFDRVVAAIRESPRGAYPVVENGRVVGIFTRTDMYRAFLDMAGADTPLSRLMKSPVVSVRADDPLSDAAMELIHRPIKHLVVVDGSDSGRAIGMVTPLDILHAIA